MTRYLNALAALAFLVASTTGVMSREGVQGFNSSQHVVTATSGTAPATLAATVPVSVLHFKAKCDGVTDDSAAFQDAANALRTISIPKGTCVLKSTVTLSFSSCFVGQGQYVSLLDWQGGAGSMLKITQRDACIEHLGFTNSAATATTAIEVAKGFDGKNAFVRENAIINTNFFTNGIYISDGDFVVVEGNNITSATNSIVVHPAAVGTTGDYIRDNSTSGGVGISFLTDVNALPIEGIHVMSNTILSTGAAIYIQRCLDCHLIDNIFTFSIDGTNPGAMVVDGSVTGGGVVRLKSTNNWYAVGSTNTAVNTTGTVSLAATSGFTSVGDTIVGYGHYGILAGLGGSKNISGAIFSDTKFGHASNPERSLVDMQLNDCRGCNIRGPDFSGTSFGLVLSANQSWGRLDGSMLGTAVPLPLVSVSSPNFFFGRQSLLNVTMATITSGTATILNGATTATITHGLWTTPAAGSVNIQATNATAAALSTYLTACGSTTCTLNSTAAPGADATFAWQADVSR